MKQTETWKIWFRRYSKEGKHVGSGVLFRGYTTKYVAQRKMKYLNTMLPDGGYRILLASKENPFVRKEARK